MKYSVEWLLPMPGSTVYVSLLMSKFQNVGIKCGDFATATWRGPVICKCRQCCVWEWGGGNPLSTRVSHTQPYNRNLKVGHAIAELKQTCLVTKKLHLNVIDGEVILGTQQSKRVPIPKVVLTASDLDHSFVLCCRQFIAWAMAINKAQK